VIDIKGKSNAHVLSKSMAFIFAINDGFVGMFGIHKETIKPFERLTWYFGHMENGEGVFGRRMSA